MTNPSAPRNVQVSANGLTFTCLELGEGPLVLCLHGFPDHAPSFVPLMTHLSQHGFRAVAPYMRGYAPTATPEGATFQSAALAQDAVGVIEQLSGDKPAFVIGHDWGAFAAYGAAVLAPQRIQRLVTVAVPYGPGLGHALVTDPTQQLRSWYMFFLLAPFAPAALAHDDFALVERLWRAWSPGWQPPASLIDAVKTTFRRPGVAAAAINYYRHTFMPHLQSPALADLQARIGTAPITVPTLYLHGEEDGCIGSEAAAGMEALFTADYRAISVPRSGHFLHLERSELFHDAVTEFLLA